MTGHDSTLTAALFGKLPGHGDFVRAGAHGPAQLAFATWLSAAVERSHGELPAEPVRFLFTSEQELFVGAWVASQDEVGRSFPLASLRPVPSELVSASWSLLPALYANHLASLERCLRTGLDEGLAWLKLALARLTEPHASELPGLMHDARGHLSSQRVSEFAARVFASSVVEPLCYAVDTLRRAVQLEGEALTLDAPAHTAFDLFVWLELLQRGQASAHVARGVVWSEQRGRALISLGSPAEQILAFLLNPQHRGTQRWPLWTDSQEAATAARATLPVRTRALLESDASLLDLLVAHYGEG